MNNKLINIKYIEPDGTSENWTPDGAIKISTDNLSLAFSKEELPLIFFEHEGLDNHRSNDIQQWLNERGYICNKSARNTICLLNN
jgi:hypothetical protein